MHIHLQRDRCNCRRLIAPGVHAVQPSLLRPFLLEHQLFSQKIANALDKSAFYLADINGGIQAPTHVIDNICAKDLHLTGQDVHFHHRACAGIGEADKRINNAADRARRAEFDARYYRLVFRALECHCRHRSGAALDGRGKAGNQVHAFAISKLHQVLPDKFLYLFYLLCLLVIDLGLYFCSPTLLAVVPEIYVPLLAICWAVFFQHLISKFHEPRG